MIRKLLQTAFAGSAAVGLTGVFSTVVSALSLREDVERADQALVLWGRSVLASAGVRHEAVGLENPTPGQLSAVRVIEHTWHSALITWLSGRASIAQVRTDIETACRLIDVTAADPGPSRD